MQAPGGECLRPAARGPVLMWLRRAVRALEDAAEKRAIEEHEEEVVERVRLELEVRERGHMLEVQPQHTLVIEHSAAAGAQVAASSGENTARSGSKTSESCKCEPYIERPNASCNPAVSMRMNPRIGVAGSISPGPSLIPPFPHCKSHLTLDSTSTSKCACWQPRSSIIDIIWS
ncbi:hypothetical protein B0H21DRAFT_706024 [Amylocystis lapponica]|nr:hypothetical protein B0H21DRAFT_706024 [Amylocystis lapponica]